MRRVLGRWMLAPSVSLPVASPLAPSGTGPWTARDGPIFPHRGSPLHLTVRCSSSTAAGVACVKKTRRGKKKATTGQDEFDVPSTRGKQEARRRGTKSKCVGGAMQQEGEDERGHSAVFDAGVDEVMDGAQAIWEEKQRRMREFGKREEDEEELNPFREGRPPRRQPSTRALANDDALDDEDGACEEEGGASGGPCAVDDPASTLAEESLFLKDRFPDLAAEYDTEAHQAPLDEVLVDSAHVASWKCVECGFKWESGVFVRTCLRTRCPECEKGRNPRLGGRFVQLWDHSLNDPCIDPKEVAASSNKAVFWHCPSCGNSYQARIKDMVADKAKCPSCSLLSLHADFGEDENGLLQEWHPLKNGDLQPSQVKPTDHTKLWWLCMACGHEWEATLAARLARSRRTKGRNCPVCHGKGKG